MEVIIRPNADTVTDLVACIIGRELRNNPRLVMGLDGTATDLVAECANYEQLIAECGGLETHYDRSNKLKARGHSSLLDSVLRGQRD